MQCTMVVSLLSGLLVARLTSKCEGAVCGRQEKCAETQLRRRPHGCTTCCKLKVYYLLRLSQRHDMHTGNFEKAKGIAVQAG